MAEYHYVRFEIADVYSSSDPFETEDEAMEYAEHLNRRGGVHAEVRGPIKDDDVQFTEHNL